MAMTLCCASNASNGTCPVNHLHGGLHRQTELLREFGVPPVEALDQHRELRGAQQDATVLGLRLNQPSLLKPLRQQAHAFSVTPQQLHEISPTAVMELPMFGKMAPATGRPAKEKKQQNRNRNLKTNTP